MTKIYACLIGNWVCLNDDPDCKIGRDHSSTKSYEDSFEFNIINNDPFATMNA